MNPKFLLQDQQYQFPYHYIPHLDGRGVGHKARELHWGLKYLCYQLHVRELVRGLAPSSVLDVGCGDGVLLGSLAGEVERRVGVDLSARAIGFARAFYPEVEYLVADAAVLTESFDLVSAIEVLEHIPDDKVGNFFRTLARRARAGGAVLISVPTVVVPLKEKHFRHYDIVSFRAQLEASQCPLRIMRVDYVYHHDYLMRVYKRLTSNRLWTGEIHPLQRHIWRHVWDNLRYSTPDRAHVMVVVLERVDE